MVVDYIVDEEVGLVSPNRLIYEKDDLRRYIATTVLQESENEELHTVAIEVAKIVARALGKRNALGHLEIYVRRKRTPDGKLVVLFGEDAERAAGAMLPRMVRGTGRMDVVQLHILQQFARDRFLTAVKDIGNYAKRSFPTGIQLEIAYRTNLRNRV